MNLPTMSEIIFLLLAILGAIGGAWWRIEAKMAASDENCVLLQRELGEYKLYVAQNHVSAVVLRETEQRLLMAIDRLADRLESVVDRLEKTNRGIHPDARQNS